MNEQERITVAAIRALAALEARHKSFMTHIASESDLGVNGGTVTAGDGKLTVTTLGVTTVANCRPIAVDGIPVAMEYSFTTPFKGEETPIWRLYLDQSGTLHEDSAFSNRFGDYNGTYFRSNIVVALANKLLMSPVFAPSA